MDYEFNFNLNYKLLILSSVEVLKSENSIKIVPSGYRNSFMEFVILLVRIIIVISLTSINPLSIPLNVCHNNKWIFILSERTIYDKD